MIAPGCLIRKCVIGLFQLHEELVVASRFVWMVDQRQLLVLRLNLLLVRRDTHLEQWVDYKSFNPILTYAPLKSHMGQSWPFRSRIEIFGRQSWQRISIPGI